jgi:hypothetical protein
MTAFRHVVGHINIRLSGVSSDIMFVQSFVTTGELIQNSKWKQRHAHTECGDHESLHFILLRKKRHAINEHSQLSCEHFYRGAKISFFISPWLTTLRESFTSSAILGCSFPLQHRIKILNRKIYK